MELDRAPQTPATSPPSEGMMEFESPVPHSALHFAVSPWKELASVCSCLPGSVQETSGDPEVS